MIQRYRTCYVVLLKIISNSSSRKFPQVGIDNISQASETSAQTCQPPTNNTTVIYINVLALN